MTGPVTVTEWGVRYQHAGTVHVDDHGDGEALARCARDTYRAITTQPLQDVTLVTRQVTYSEWGEPGEETLMSGFPLHARYAHRDAGWAGDREQAARWLTPGHVYTVQSLQVGRSSSTLSLHEVPGEWFNTVLFEPDHGPATEDDEEEVTSVSEPDGISLHSVSCNDPDCPTYEGAGECMDPGEYEAAEQDADAETGQDHDHNGEDSHVHEANPF